MDSLSGLGVFVQVAETRSFSEAGRALGVSPSAVGKSIARMEARLKVRLFHRSTRHVALTPEGELFLERCRRILCEVEAAELELSETADAPRGKLRVSLPRYSGLFEPAIAAFMRQYPEVELDLDFTDRMVDVIGEGYDAVVRSGEMDDSGLKRRRLGRFRRILAASPGYLAEHGTPRRAADLLRHACLHYRYPSTGRLERWPLKLAPQAQAPELPQTLVCNSVEMRVFLALGGQGIVCLPDFTIREEMAAGRLQSVLDEQTRGNATMWALWPASRHASPKLRVFIDHLARHLFP
ncbi:HTH-type transcriptional regulator DmlR [Achromobacter anxifer]|uniref:HTH-type transcriptional regulator DmlR n=1 Tax=Achromobacter anxifer TaxID=1287737 RepID=A0A6S7EXQ1_9BURK|nr:LysR family transcriptional regulator [Achromobacter anxifer]CAB3926707.1 HTH-type transcriptional regulator DmlR [Achromobacter anxifer]CAB5517454.1 HTH-type transcriptional regulator DmlR [Achromobacter anxifer]